MSEPPAFLPTQPPAPTAAAEAPAPLAPAELVPPPRWWERFAWYAGVMLLTSLLTFPIWNRDLHAPFYYDLDALLYLPLTKTVVKEGFWSYWHTERLGAPGAQELYDFPIIDYLHFACLWLLGQFFSDLLLVYNIYSLLTYPLTALTAMWVLRWLKLSLPTAALGGFLYAFLPYHQERYHYHYFLAAYWWIPVSLMPALAICQGNYPYFRRGPDGGYLPLHIDWAKVKATASGAIRFRGAAWRTLVVWLGQGIRWLIRNLFTWRVSSQLMLGAVTASAGAYYAFFACAIYAFVGTYAWFVYRTWRAAMSALLVIAPVMAVGFAYHLPTFIYQYRYGNNPIALRQPHEAENYGLKLSHLLLPTHDHNFRPFADIRSRYTSSMRPADDENAGAFGLVASAGLMGLLCLALLPYRRRWPEGPIVALTVYLVLLATVGAFGSLFNLLVTPQIRAYNRLSVFIAFFSLFAVLWWLDRFLLTRTGRTMRRLRYPLLAALLIIGYLDQTPWGWNPLNPNAMAEIDLFAERYRADRRFFKEIERSMPAGAKIFCLPYSGFPESPPVNKMPAYEHARGYVMTDTLYWSFGAIRGREADVWQRDVVDVRAPTPEGKAELMLKRIVARGFDGVLIDGRGYRMAEGGHQALKLIKGFHDAYAAEMGKNGALLPVIVHEDGKQYFLDVQPFRNAWREKKPAEYAAMEAAERDWVAPLWLAGFLATTPNDAGERYVWGVRDASLILVNPTDRTRKFDISFTIGVDTGGPFEFTLSGLVNDTFSLENVIGKDEPDNKRYGIPRKYESVEVPPCRSTIRIRCRPPDYFATDTRGLCYFIKDFKMTER